MTLEIRSGLIALADSVRANFSANGVDAEVTRVGLRYRMLWPKRSRVCFIPGIFRGEKDPKPTDEGRLTAPEHTKSQSPRELATWERKVTVSVLGVDIAQKDDEQAQIEAVESLLELTIRAMVTASKPNGTGEAWLSNPKDPLAVKEYGLAGQGSIFFDDSTVTRIYPPADISYGAELLVSFTQRGPFFDAPETLLFPLAHLNRSES